MIFLMRMYFFENQKWNSDSIALFNCFVDDTTSKNIIKIKLRHSVDYEFQNLFIFIESEVKDIKRIILIFYQMF